MHEVATPVVAPVEDLEASFKRTTLSHFRHWLSSCMPGYEPGPPVSRMWEAYPHGAILATSDWCWWSLQRVTHDGYALAMQLGCPGLVIAEGRLGAAVLCWPNGKAALPVLRMASFAAAESDKPVYVDPQRFLEAKGFDLAEDVIACAVALKTPYVCASAGIVTLQPAPPATGSDKAGRGLSASKSPSSQSVCSSETTRSGYFRARKKGQERTTSLP